MHVKRLTIMFAFTLPLFSLLLLFSSTTAQAQPYIAIEHFLLDCGSSSTATSDQKWDGDHHSEFIPSNITTTSFTSTPYHRDSSVPQTPYSTARIFNTSSFTYTFPVSQGPKFLRLYFYPATYSNLNANQSFFSVSSNGYSLLTNFSAFATASFLGNTRVGSPSVPHFFKEFAIYVQDTQLLNVTFTPSPNSYAFINGIEIVSMPENLYFNAMNLKYVGQNSGPVINNKTALENVYRLNMGGGQIPGNDDTGMYRSWDQDNNYIYGPIGLTPVYQNPIAYTTETPNYTAPELIYQTQRSMGNQSELYNLTWILPVDSGFYYKLRLHFCNIIPQYTKKGQMIFTIYINNQTAEEEADLFQWTKGTGNPVFRDYIVFVSDQDGRKSKQDLWLELHPNPNSEEYRDGYLNGLEVFRLSMNGNLSSPNPELSPSAQLPRPTSPVKENTKKTPPYAVIIGGGGGGLILWSILALIVFKQRRAKTFGNGESKSTKSCHPSLPTDRCRHFSLEEVKIATREFSEVSYL
ncbi:receptor-like protein kinase FERONIA [Tanacetum coccineum]|uniref:Receptor-like protein kinase FERONIA n=1 Tax=Tanacetum coccineum TaxID=301880 RepID=A0ABQ5BQF7_9ASTR